MTSRQRLMATLRGERGDRPAVSFYEVGGFIVDPGDPDEFNVYNSKSWKPLIDLAENRTDLIRMMSPVRAASHISWDNAVRNEIGPRRRSRWRAMRIRTGAMRRKSGLSSSRDGAMPTSDSK